MAGAVHRTVAEALPPVAAPIVGADGTTAGALGVTAADGAEFVSPIALIARTTKVDAVPSVRLGRTTLRALRAMSGTVRTSVVPKGMSSANSGIGDPPSLAVP